MNSLSFKTEAYINDNLLKKWHSYIIHEIVICRSFDKEVAKFLEVQMSCIVMIVEVGEQRPELLGKVALLVWLSIHPKTNFAMPKTKNQLLACSGIRRRRNSSGAPANSWAVKSNKGGSSCPFGNRAFGSRRSSKKECAHASKAVQRRFGEY